MKVWLLYDCTDRLEGVYSERAKEVREQQFYEEALQNRERRNAVLAEEVKELKALRKPYLEEAERLLTVEREAKEANNTYVLKETRKERKVALRQADKLTSEISRRETKIHNSMLQTRQQIISNYGIGHWWQEEYVLEAD